MICPNCGKEMSDEHKFCGGCGYSVENSFLQSILLQDSLEQNNSTQNNIKSFIEETLDDVFSELWKSDE